METKKIIVLSQNWLDESLNRHGETVYLADVKDDMFIHFTLPDRAQKILDSGLLMLNPPYHGFGILAVCAVSTTYGRFFPGVQTTHLKVSPEELVGVIFTTDTVPQYGHPDETIWDKDVKLTSVEVVSYNDSVSLLSSSSNLPEDFTVVYDPSDMPTPNDKKVQAWAIQNCKFAKVLSLKYQP
jgi:hypothetical protein